LLDRLAYIKGIEKVILRPWYGADRTQTYKTAQEVLDALASLSSLRHITFIDVDICPDDWQLGFTEGTLPTLQSIRFQYTLPSDPPELTKDEFLYLQPYSKARIFFEVAAESKKSLDSVCLTPYMTFYLSTIKHSPDTESLYSMIHWLVLGEEYFQLHEYNLDIFMLDLISYKPRERDIILAAAKTIHFQQPIALRIQVQAGDSDMMADTPRFPDLKSNAELFAKLLPSDLSYLELCVVEPLETGLIPSLVQSLKNLDRLVIMAFAQAIQNTPVENEAQETPEEEDGNTTILLYDHRTFTQAPYSVKIVSSDENRPVIWSLELDGSEDPLWVFLVREEGGDEFEGDTDEETREYVTSMNGEIEKEMTVWFSLSESLKMINLRVHAGLAWFRDWSPYFEYDITN
jgi:hypothetical protein